MRRRILAFVAAAALSAIPNRSAADIAPGDLGWEPPSLPWQRAFSVWAPATVEDASQTVSFQNQYVALGWQCEVDFGLPASVTDVQLTYRPGEIDATVNPVLFESRYVFTCYAWNVR